MAMTPLPRDVRTLGWVSFWADVASEMVYPIIPIFVVGTLMAPATALGFVEGVAVAIVSMMRIWSGRASDEVGRRMPYIRWGYGLSSIGKPMIALATNWVGVLAARGTDRFGKGIRSVARDALIADAVPPEDAGRAFGFHRAMDSAGAAVGAVLGLIFVTLLPNQLRLIFLIAFVPGVIATGLTFMVKEKPFKRKEKKQGFGSLPSGVWRLALIMGVFGLANSSDTFILLRIKDLGFSLSLVVIAYILYNVVYSALSYPLGKLSDRVGQRNIIAVGWVLYAISYGLLAIIPGLGVWPVMILYGVSIAALDGTGKALVAAYAPKDARGTAMGLVYFVTGIAALIASTASGFMWDHVGHSAPFIAGAVLSLLACLLLPLLKPVEPAVEA